MTDESAAVVDRALTTFRAVLSPTEPAWSLCGRPLRSGDDDGLCVRCAEVAAMWDYGESAPLMIGAVRLDRPDVLGMLAAMAADR